MFVSDWDKTPVDGDMQIRFCPYRMLQRFQASLWGQAVQFAVWIVPFLRAGC